MRKNWDINAVSLLDDFIASSTSNFCLCRVGYLRPPFDKIFEEFFLKMSFFQTWKTTGRQQICLYLRGKKINKLVTLKAKTRITFACSGHRANWNTQLSPRSGCSLNEAVAIRAPAKSQERNYQAQQGASFLFETRCRSRKWRCTSEEIVIKCASIKFRGLLLGSAKEMELDTAKWFLLAAVWVMRRW